MWVNAQFSLIVNACLGFSFVNAFADWIVTYPLFIDIYDGEISRPFACVWSTILDSATSSSSEGNIYFRIDFGRVFSAWAIERISLLSSLLELLPDHLP